MPAFRFILFLNLVFLTPGFTQAIPGQPEEPVSVAAGDEPSPSTPAPPTDDEPEAAAGESEPANDESEPAIESSEPSVEYPPAVPRSRPEPRTAEKGVFEGSVGTFEFVAADQASLQIARRIGREVLEVCDEMITPPQERIPKIAVKLAPDGRGNLGDKAFDIYQDLAGDYGLAVRWNQNLPASLFIQALTESYLRQLVFTLSGRGRSEEVPSWMIAGASLRTQIAFRPELLEFLRQVGREMPMPSLESVFASGPLGEMTLEQRTAAFWFLELFEKTLPTQKRYRSFFDAVVAGGPPMEVLQSQTQEIPGFGNGIEAWWIIGFQDMVNDEKGVVFSISRSAKIIFLLNRFEIIRGGNPEFVGAENLWELRDEPLIRKELVDRLQGLQATLPRINPVFYNSLGGIGLIMQTLLDGDREDFDRAVDDFSTEIERATALAQDAQLLAEDPEADL